MSSNKTPMLKFEPPEDLATPVIALKELGAMIAREQSLPPGFYELVVEYKFGPGRLAEEEGAVGAMAITFGGLGLRRVDKASAMSIEVGENPAVRKKAASPRSRKPAKKTAK